MREERGNGRRREKGARKDDNERKRGRSPHIFQLPFLEEEEKEEEVDGEIDIRVEKAMSVSNVQSAAIALDANMNAETVSTNETVTTDDNEENGPDEKSPSERCQLASASTESWSQWKAQYREDFHRVNNSSVPGAFAISIDEKYFQCCKFNKFPRESAYILRLPLRFVLCRGKLVGCTLTRKDCEAIVVEINRCWRQAGIQFFLIDEVYVNYAPDNDYNGMSLYEIREGINNLARGPDGRMAGKEKRRDIFLRHLMKDRDFDSMEAFNVWIFDFIGNTSQGVCIDRETHTVIIGQRSNKGYPEITNRPLDCLGKTISHELGHALSLEHLLQRPFSCGSARNDSGFKNLMEGGNDAKGGGGSYLDDWQILEARGEACRIMQCATHTQFIKFKNWKGQKENGDDSSQDANWQVWDSMIYWLLLVTPICILGAIAYYSIVNDSTNGYAALATACLMLLYFGVEWTPSEHKNGDEVIDLNKIKSS